MQIPIRFRAKKAVGKLMRSSATTISTKISWAESINASALLEFKSSQATLEPRIRSRVYSFPLPLRRSQLAHCSRSSSRPIFRLESQGTIPFSSRVAHMTAIGIWAKLTA